MALQPRPPGPLRVILYIEVGEYWSIMETDCGARSYEYSVNWKFMERLLWRYSRMENYKNIEMFQQIVNKLGFTPEEYNDDVSVDTHERDDLPNPFEKLTLEELLFLRENNYFLPKQ